MDHYSYTGSSCLGSLEAAIEIYIDEEMLLNQIIGTGKTLPHETLRDLVPFVPLKKHEKHLRRSVVFGKVAGCSSMGVLFFLTFFKLHKWRKASQLYCYYLTLGYGGGFKENDNVTYREREDSDGEFDDVNGFDSVLLQIYT